MKLIFAGGGTAGHINPAIAIAKQMTLEEPSTQILFVGTKKGLEKELVPNEGFNIKYINVEGFERKFSIHNLKVIAKALTSIGEAKKIIKDFGPDVIIGTGGYVCGPVMLAAFNKIPTIVHEQNVIPGITVKLLKRFVDVVAISFTQSIKYLSGAKKIIHTGNPIRNELLNVSYEHARNKLELDKRPFIAVIGGSLGAQEINNAFIRFILENKNKFQILLSTGEIDYDRVINILKDNHFKFEKYPNIRIKPYVYDMADVYAAADLLVTRAGAITVSEIAALGKPSILIPSPNVAHNHQQYNASAMQQDGASIMILEKDVNRRLSHTIHNLITDPKRLKELSENAYKIGVRYGSKKICTIIKKLKNSV